jgi:tRNA threonylcarbamoyladenosine biosynthesis protein TsaE
MSDEPNNARQFFSCSSLVTRHSSLLSRHSSLVTRHCSSVTRHFSLVTHSPEETVKFGRELATELHPPCMVLLEGELGSGKTTLVKGILASLTSIPEDEVTSPSFTLVHEYGAGGKVYHVDLYRVEGARDLATLGLDDLLGQDATILIEWGEKLGEDVPRPCVRIHLEHLGRDERRITVERLT